MKYERFISEHKLIRIGLLILVISVCLVFYSCKKNTIDESKFESSDNNSIESIAASTTNSANTNDIEKTDEIDLASNEIDSDVSKIEEESEYEQPVIVDKTEEVTEEDNSTDNYVEEKTEDDILEYILPYYQQNNETIGYIKINDTPIDYPVLQAEDNRYYLHYDFNHNPSSKGCVFLDYKCNFQDFSSTRNNILYAHRMKDGTMFKGIVNYFDEDFYSKHKVISFDTLYSQYQWEVFSVFETHIRFNYINTVFESDEIWVDFLNECKDKSIYESDVQLDADDIVLTLSTCAIDDMRRCVVMTKLVGQSNDESSTLVSDVLIPSDEDMYIEEDE